MSFLLGWPIFRCYVSFREGIIFANLPAVVPPWSNQSLMSVWGREGKDGEKQEKLIFSNSSKHTSLLVSHEIIVHFFFKDIIRNAG